VLLAFSLSLSFIFLSKLLLEQGLFPIREGCAFCDCELDHMKTIFLISDHGGFSCAECTTHLEEDQLRNKREGRELWELLGGVANQKYTQLLELAIEDPDAMESLLHYFNYQFGFQRDHFKSLQMVI